MKALVAVVAALVALPLAGCGEGPDRFEAYCQVVAEEKTELTDALAESGGSSGLLPALPVFERLEEAAPDDIADDWSLIVQRLSALDDALEAAGVDPATYDPVDPPDGVSDEERETISLAAGGLSTEAVGESLANVQQQARDVCRTELSL